MNKRLILILIICVSSFGAFSQSNDSATVRKIVNETMMYGTAYKNLRVLCKQVGERLSGSAGYYKGVKFAEQMMKNSGADTVYLQQCLVPHWVRGKKESGYLVLSSGKKYPLNLCALGDAVGTGDKGISGQVIEINSFDQLAKEGAENIKGKIVFFNFPMNQTYIGTFKAYGESGVSRTHGPANAAKYGAKGVLVRSLAINLNDYPHTGTTIYNDSFPKIPAVAISTNDAEYLSAQLKKAPDTKAYFKTFCKMLPDTTGYNVIGEIKGNEFPGEIITVGGHLDSWDLAEGANDDGTGVVQSMEVLRNLKSIGIHPRRTIRAVLFANEENGGRGSAKYLNEAKEKNEHHMFALESDGGGFTPRGFSLEMNADKRAKILQWQNLFHPYGLYEWDESGSGSDVEPLKNIGAALAGLNVDSQRYFDIHHAATDVFEKVSERELNLGAATMAALIYLVSEHGL